MRSSIHSRFAKTRRSACPGCLRRIVRAMIRFYLGEEPVLRNVPTWQLRKPEDLRYALDHLAELVVKEVQGSGGYGMMIGPVSTRAQLDDFRKRIEANPA